MQQLIRRSFTELMAAHAFDYLFIKSMDDNHCFERITCLRFHQFTLVDRVGIVRFTIDRNIKIRKIKWTNSFYINNARSHCVCVSVQKRVFNLKTNSKWIESVSILNTQTKKYSHFSPVHSMMESLHRLWIVYSLHLCLDSKWARSFKRILLFGILSRCD